MANKSVVPVLSSSLDLVPTHKLDYLGTGVTNNRKKTIPFAE